MSFEKFGVMVTMTVDPNLVSRVGVDANGDSNVKWTRWGDTASVTIDNLVMYPGDDFSQAVNFSFLKYNKDSGEYENSVAQVPVEVRITTDFNFTYESFKVTAEEFPYIADRLKTDVSAEHFFPIGVKFTALQNTGNPYNYIANTPWRDVGPLGVEKTVSQIISRYIDTQYVDVTNTTGPDYSYKTFNAGDEVYFQPDNATDFKNNASYATNGVEITDFDLGFYWPMTHETNKRLYNNSTNDDKKYYTPAEIDEIGTWLMSQNRNFAVSVTFSVSVEQIIPT